MGSVVVPSSLWRRSESLARNGLDEVAWWPLDALRVLELLKETATAVLGGNVYVRKGGLLEPALEKWAAERAPRETPGRFATRSNSVAQQYLSELLKRAQGEARVVLVLSQPLEPTPESEDGTVDDGHDPWNEPGHRHPRAQALMAEELWDCVNESAPFGSDEGAEAYVAYRDWRADNPGAPLLDCLAWIGDESDYADAFTFDATIIATVLGQLVDEGHIDAGAKSFARTAIKRQVKGAADDEERGTLLTQVAAAIEAG